MADTIKGGGGGGGSMQDNGFNTLMKPLFKKHCVAMY